MSKKIIILSILVLLTTSFVTSPVIAGDENDPEIQDESGDTIWNHLDIISAWFYETPDEPEFLFISMEVNNINSVWMGAAYLVEFTSEKGRYASSAMLGSYVDVKWRCGDYSNGANTKISDLSACEGSFSRSVNTLTWKIPKSQVGNLKAGDVLTHTRADSCVTGKFFFLLPLRGLPGFHDIAPDEGYGKEYTILY
jgi:hypothetical protein